MKTHFDTGLFKQVILHPFILGLCLLVSITPLVIIGHHFLDRLDYLKEKEDDVHSLHNKVNISKNKKISDERIAAQMKGADPAYLEKNLETLPLLASEIKKWEQLSENTTSITAVNNRLSFLRGDKNHLRFKQNKISSEPPYQEILANQLHPTQVSEEDLKRILCSIDGIKIGRFIPLEKRPQLIIESFDLTKSIDPDLKEKVFILQMNILKRELTMDLSP